MKQKYLTLVALFLFSFTQAQIPVNDEVQNATVITNLLPFGDYNVQTQNATTASGGGMSGCDLGTTYTRIYYQYRSAVNTIIRIKLTNSSSNSIIAVYSSNANATADNQLSLVSSCTYTSDLSIDIQSFLYYYIVVSNPDGATNILISNINSNVVNIPDSNFKNALLNNSNINTNSDTEIQVNEAFFTDEIFVDNRNISDLTGIEAFTSLTKLWCSYNNLTALDVSFNIELREFNCYGNDLSSLNLIQNVNLENLDASFHDNLGNIDLSQNTNLETLLLYDCGLTNDFDVTNNLALKYLVIGGDNISNVNLTQNINLEELILENTDYTNIDLSVFPNLENLRISNNNLTALNVTQNPNLRNLDCTKNESLTSLDITQNLLLNNLYASDTGISSIDLLQNTNLVQLFWNNCDVTNIDLSNNIDLIDLYLSNNLLTLLDLSQNINLERLNVSDNQISNLNISGLDYLWYLKASNNPFSTVDLSQNPELRILTITYSSLISLDLDQNLNLWNVHLKNNEFIEQINFKTGNNTIFDLPNMEYYTNSGMGWTLGTSNFNTINSPNLQTICVDDVNYATTTFTDIDPNVVFVDDCSISSINYNSIQGSITFDDENNGCDTNDFIVANQLVQATDGVNNIATFTNSTGDYTLYLNENTYNTEVVGLATNFSATPNPYNTTFTGFGTSENANFCITSSQTINDVNVVLLPVNQARPGFDANYQLVYENIGTTLISGNVTLNFDDASQTFVSANPSESTSDFNSITFNYTNLQPFETRTIDVVMNTFPPTTVNDGDILNFTATINPVSGDNHVEDNIFNLEQTVVNSYDPNDKQVLQGDEISLTQASEYLDYIIRFQNTGSASAINVVITDELSSKLDWNTIKPLSSSHEFSIRILNGSFVEFTFNNISLSAQQDDEEGSKGFVAFKIKPKEDVLVGDFIYGNANIYFDFNAPILTNTVATEIVANLSVPEHEIHKVIIYPNPVSDYLFIESKNTIKSITIYDVNGRLLQKLALTGSDTNTKINMTTLSKGLYFVSIKTDAGEQTTKIIKD